MASVDTTWLDRAKDLLPRIGSVRPQGSPPANPDWAQAYALVAIAEALTGIEFLLGVVLERGSVPITNAER